MRTKLTLVAASLATLMMSSAHAAPTPPPAAADLSISARVVPSACNFDVANNGTFDYGDIPGSTLSASNKTDLPAKQLTYTISCNTPTAVGLSIVDNRSGTVGADPDHPMHSFGVGQVDGVNIGGNTYTLINTGVTVDGNVGSITITENGGSMFYTASPRVNLYNTNTSDIFWSFMMKAPIEGDPSFHWPVTTVTGNLEANLSIAPTSSLDMSQTINIDGFATLQLTIY